MAGDIVNGGDLAKYRFLDLAPIVGAWTPGAETAAAWREDRRRKLALYSRGRIGLYVGVGDRDGLQQQIGVGMGGVLIEIVGQRDLADLAQVHHAHAVGDVLHDG